MWFASWQIANQVQWWRTFRRSTSENQVPTSKLLRQTQLPWCVCTPTINAWWETFFPPISHGVGALLTYLYKWVLCRFATSKQTHARAFQTMNDVSTFEKFKRDHSELTPLVSKYSFKKFKPWFVHQSVQEEVEQTFLCLHTCCSNCNAIARLKYWQIQTANRNIHTNPHRSATHSLLIKATPNIA